MTATAETVSSKIKIVCISDTHSHGPGQGFKLPAGDMLIHAGDLTNQGDPHEIVRAAKWLAEADFAIKVIIAGNHDLSLDDKYQLKHETGWTVETSNTTQCRQLIENVPGVVYLDHEARDINVRGLRLRIFGSPYSIDAGKQNWAFQYAQAGAKDVWAAIPSGTDILVTHSPPFGILDESSHWTSGGCPALLEAVQKVQPRLHVFGHHHEDRGALSIAWHLEGHRTITSWSDPGADNRKQSLLDLTCRQLSTPDTTTFINASIMKRSWSRSAAKEFNKPIVLAINVDQFATT